MNLGGSGLVFENPREGYYGHHYTKTLSLILSNSTMITLSLSLSLSLSLFSLSLSLTHTHTLSFVAILSSYIGSDRILYAFYPELVRKY